jgi:hypothetical protein
MNDLKKLLFERLLENNVSILVRPSLCEGIPENTVDLNQLDYGLNLANPILDFVVNDKGISAILSFNQVPTQTFVPWEALVALYSSPGAFCCAWPCDKMGVHVSVFKNEHPLNAAPSPPPAKPEQPKLAVVK